MLELSDLNKSSIEIGEDLLEIEKALIRGLSKSFGFLADADWEDRRQTLIDQAADLRKQAVMEALPDAEGAVLHESAERKRNILDSFAGKSLHDAFEPFMQECIRFVTEWNNVVDDPERQLPIIDPNNPEHVNEVKKEMTAIYVQHAKYHGVDMDPHGIHDKVCWAITKAISLNLDKSDEELIELAIIEMALAMAKINEETGHEFAIPDTNDPNAREFVIESIKEARTMAKEHFGDMDKYMKHLSHSKEAIQSIEI